MLFWFANYFRTCESPVPLSMKLTLERQPRSQSEGKGPGNKVVFNAQKKAGKEIEMAAKKERITAS